MEPTQEPSGLLGMLGAGLTSLVMGGLWLRSKLSRDSVTIAADRAEKDMLERLQDENKDLRMALGAMTDERNSLVREVGEMTGSIRALEASQKQLLEQVALLSQQVNTLRTALQRAGHERRS